MLRMPYKDLLNSSNNFLLYAYCLTALWVTFGPWHIGT